MAVSCGTASSVRSRLHFAHSLRLCFLLGVCVSLRLKRRVRCTRSAARLRPPEPSELEPLSSLPPAASSSSSSCQRKARHGITVRRTSAVSQRTRARGCGTRACTCVGACVCKGAPKCNEAQWGRRCAATCCTSGQRTCSGSRTTDRCFAVRCSAVSHAALQALQHAARCVALQHAARGLQTCRWRDGFEAFDQRVGLVDKLGIFNGDARRLLHSTAVPHGRQCSPVRRRTLVPC